MKIKTLIELFTALAKVHGDIEMVVLDPVQTTGETSQWTPDFLPFVTDSTNEDGRVTTIGLLLPRPQQVTMTDVEGNQFRPLGD